MICGPRVSAYGMNHLDFDSLQFLYSVSNLTKEEEEAGADPDTEWYADAPFEKRNGLWEAPEATLLLQLNLDRGTLQVILSPEAGHFGKCSPCYPDQADGETEGCYLGYKLPREFICKESRLY